MVLIVAIGLVLSVNSPIFITAVQAKAKPIKIGAITPLTGTSELEGRDIDRGEKIALEEINAAGGVLGRPLKMIVEDTATRPAEAMDAIHKLVEVDRVPVVIGGYFSSIAIPTGRFTNSHKVVQIAFATSPKLREVGPYFFGVAGLDELMATNTVKFAIEDTGHKRFSILVDDSAYGIGILNYAKKQIEKSGGEVLSVVKYERNKNDYRAELQRVFAPNPDIVIGTVVGKDARTIFKQAYELGLRPKYGWYLCWVSLATAPSIPETVEGVKGLIGVYKGGTAERFNKKYKEKYGQYPPTCWGHYSYDATWLAALAINFAHSTDPEKIRKALFKIAPIYRGVSGGGDKTFDEDGMQKVEEYQKVICKNGELIIYQGK